MVYRMGFDGLFIVVVSREIVSDYPSRRRWNPKGFLLLYEAAVGGLSLCVDWRMGSSCVGIALSFFALEISQKAVARWMLPQSRL